MALSRSSVVCCVVIAGFIFFVFNSPQLSPFSRFSTITTHPHVSTEEGNFEATHPGPPFFISEQLDFKKAEEATRPGPHFGEPHFR